MKLAGPGKPAPAAARAGKFVKMAITD